MDRDDVARTMPAIRAAFERLKEQVREGRLPEAGAQLFGACVDWGRELLVIYQRDGREALGRRDPLTRFFVTRFRGMPEPGDLGGAPDTAAFLLAFTAFSYLDGLFEETGIGEHVGFDEDGHWIVRRVVAELDDGTSLRATQAGRAWAFDLMPIYTAKAQALEHFITERFGGDFDAFLWRYVADHDLAFDLEQAWRPLQQSNEAAHAHPGA